jgi:hypothetical protein
VALRGLGLIVALAFAGFGTLWWIQGNTEAIPFAIAGGVVFVYLLTAKKVS